MTRPTSGSVRIIGGRWRGSKLPVPDAAGLRPTADRVRETVFNWLAPRIAGARALDLFAGSGALGLEAASRGAAQVILVEKDPALAAALRANADRLARTDAAKVVEVVCADGLRWLARASDERFDLVFLDPPFAAGLWQSALAALEPWLAEDAWLYLEAPREGAPAIGRQWLPHRSGETREVRYALFRRDAATLAQGPTRQDPARA
ncbi:MAG TPA: 16S rRNA (guanine(966)-N(2))-methyltransferase RsmD [Xanthomonadaceae bacterium]